MFGGDMTDQARSGRHQRILGLFEPSSGCGLEIGPLYDPVVRRGEASVSYVDVHSGEDLKRYYSAHPGVPLDKIIDPEFVLIGPDGPRSLPEAVKDGAPFDWVVASHVIEHVPDLIGWLEEVSEILVDDGTLVLAVPDRRFSFDAQRTPTTVGEILLANQHQDKIPSARAIYDHFSRVITVDAGDAWRGDLPGPEARIHPLEYVVEQLRLAREDSQYVDCHVWLFTPATFVEQLAELGRLDLVPFTVQTVVPTARGELEFYVVLRRIARGLGAPERDLARARGILSWTDDEPDLRPETDAAAPTPTGPLDPGSRLADGPLSPREERLIRAKRTLMTRARRSISAIRSRPR
jgi:hypothetical protein